MGVMSDEQDRVGNFHSFDSRLPADDIRLQNSGGCQIPLIDKTASFRTCRLLDRQQQRWRIQFRKIGGKNGKYIVGTGSYHTLVRFFGCGSFRGSSAAHRRDYEVFDQKAGSRGWEHSRGHSIGIGHSLSRPHSSRCHSLTTK